MAWTDTWDDTLPLDSSAASLLGADLRSLKLDIQQRMGAITGTSTSLPPFGSDAQPINWTGVVCFATDNGHVYRWSGSAWVDITSTFFAPQVQSVFVDGAVHTATENGTPTVMSNVTIPMGVLAIGNKITVKARVSCNGAQSGQLLLQIGGVNLLNQNIFATLAANFVLEAELIVTGATALTAYATLESFVSINQPGTILNVGFTTPTVTIANQVVIATSSGSGSGGNTYTGDLLTVKIN
jgi:hypothetical protein